MITIKTPEDIEILREGGKRLACILREVSELVKPGVTTDFLNAKAEELIREGGDTAAFFNYKIPGARRAYPSSLCVSINDEVVHGISNEKPRVIKEGDVVSLDLGLVHKKLITDHAVTVIAGKANEKIEKLLKVTRDSLYVGIDAVKPGARTGDVGFAIESFVRPYNFGIVEELAGHGVGYEVHEDPFVPNFGNKNEGALLKVGMVIAIEPMLTLGRPDVFLAKDGFTFKTKDKSIAAHFEHTVVITKDGAEILTQE